MKNRDVVLSICSLLLGIALGASSVLYAQEVAYSGVTPDAAQTGAFHRAPNKEGPFNPLHFKRRALKRAQKVLPRAESAPRPQGE